jgi:geranylgeranyl diphosphate synthase type I
MTNELDTLSAAFLPAIEAEMRAVLNLKDGNGRSEPFYGMIHYHMGWADEALRRVDHNGGKRIRPLLCLLTCAAAGGEWQLAVPAAAAIEILHNFSLVHDDIQDDSPTRRGQPTVWSLWGRPQAINTGDAMFALAHLAMARLADLGVPPGIVIRALRRFDETCVALTLGQYTDMSFESRDRVSADEYVGMITDKTAALLALSTELGALIAGADDEQIENFQKFGLNLGLAFQVQDDILGIWGDEKVTGKSAATDITTRKKTLPVLYALARSETLRELYAADDADGDFVRAVVAELDQTGARLYAIERTGYYSESAMDSLAAARPVEPADAALRQLTDMLLKRDY